MSMNRTIVGLFDNLPGAIEAVLKLSPHLGSSQLSLVTRRNHHGAVIKPREEFAGELAYGSSEPLQPLDGLLIQTANLQVPVLGKVAAAGPLGGALAQEDKSLTDALTYYGLGLDNANYYQDKVRDNCTLVLIETDNSKVNAVANQLKSYGAFGVDKWGTSIDHPLHPYG